MSLAVAIWPDDRLGELVQVVGRRAGLGSPLGAMPSSPAEPPGAAVARLARLAEVESEQVSAAYAEVPDALRRLAPGLVRLPATEDAPAGWLGLVRGRPRELRVVGVDGQEHGLPVAPVVDRLRREIDRQAAPSAEALLDVAGLAGPRRLAARDALVARSVPGWRCSGLWVLRPDPGASLFQQARVARLGGPLLGFVIGHFGAYAALLGSWWLLGKGVLSGNLDMGWMTGWALLLLSSTPLRMLTTWCQGVVAVRGGALLKQRLLAGALRSSPEALRREGAGQLHGRTVEAQAVEQLALSGSFSALVAMLELVLAALVLSAGAGGVWLAGLLAAHTVLILGLAVQDWRLRRRWADGRLGITLSLVENMVGHRTRLAQQEPARWHDGEDGTLTAYLESSRRLDRSGALLAALASRGWVLLGLSGLAVAMVVGDGGTTGVAVALGGILLAQRSLGRLAGGALSLTGAAVAAEKALPLVAAATQQEPAPTLREPAPAAGGGEGAPVLVARGLRFTYPGRTRPVLDGVDLTLRRGDRLLLEGESGGGKSTLAALLSGLRRPTGGLLTAGGLDLPSLGPAGWRQRVVVAPQFHDNHLLSGTLAYNLLLARRWPPSPEDLEEAGGLCAELGLGGLLERMPSGLFTLVGESGWQLSHGEASRVFLARALLQHAEVVILDESFGALDPATMQRCMAVAVERSSTVVVIAHP